MSFTLNKILFLIITLGFVFTLGMSFYTYLYQKDYFFIVEGTCDPGLEKCFQRECAELDECPSEELSYYKSYKVSASDFANCTNNSCKAECESGVFACIPILCEEETQENTCSK
jgi:hypothetical protein